MQDLLVMWKNIPKEHALFLPEGSLTILPAVYMNEALEDSYVSFFPALTNFSLVFSQYLNMLYVLLDAVM